MKRGGGDNRGLPPELLIPLEHIPPTDEVKEILITLDENPENFQMVIGRDVVLCSSCMKYFHTTDLEAHCDQTHEKQKQRKKTKEDDDGPFHRLAQYLKWRAEQLADSPEFFKTKEHEFGDVIESKAKQLIQDQEFFEGFEKRHPDVVKKCVETMATKMILDYLEQIK